MVMKLPLTTNLENEEANVKEKVVVTSTTVQKISIHLGVLRGEITMRILEPKKGRWKNARTKGKGKGNSKQQLQDGKWKPKGKGKGKGPRNGGKGNWKGSKGSGKSKGKGGKGYAKGKQWQH